MENEELRADYKNATFTLSLLKLGIYVHSTAEWHACSAHVAVDSIYYVTSQFNYTECENCCKNTKSTLKSR